MKIDTSKIKKIMKKLSRKDPILFRTLQKKISQIGTVDIIVIDEHFKNLRGSMSHLKRVRLGSFVLTFRLKGTTIIFENFCHHKESYR
ncbi:MAG: hypothetical protein U9Q69_05320 [Nanoarchaeota archaeon]|nr:hypothetical protein [Nanoarchaeota archaeon]